MFKATGGTPALEIEHTGTGNALEIRAQGDGDAIAVRRDGVKIWSVSAAGGDGATPTISLPPFLGRTMVTTCASGHGWTTNGAGVASSNMNDTSDSIHSDQMFTITTAGTGVAAQMRKTAGTSFDLTGKAIEFWLKVDSATDVASIDVYAGSSGFAHYYRFRVQTGGTANTYYLNDDEWVRFVVNWQDLTQTSGSPSRAAITDWQISVVDRNSTAITYHLGGLALVPDGSSVWANGVVSITFDDGWASQYTEGRKKLGTYGFPATAYQIKETIGTSGYMTLDQLHQLQEQAGWDIASHAYSLDIHNTGHLGVALPDIESDMQNIRGWLKTNGFRGADNFAYPKGEFNSRTLEIMRRYYNTSRTIIDVTHETIPVANPHRIRARSVVNSDSTATLQTLIDNAYAQKGWLILNFHKIVTTPAASTEYSIANFGTVVDYLNTKGIPVRTVADVLATR